MRRILQTLVAVVVVAVLATFVTSTSASAAESDAVVPPAALVGCDTYRPGGGWDKRDAISDGTTGSNDEIPVRPKHLRLGEPCVQQNPGGPDFYIPMLVSDVPVPMVDDDEDGEDDPYEAGSCNGGEVIASLGAPTREWIDEQVICSSIQERARGGSPEAWLDSRGNRVFFDLEVVSDREFTVGFSEIVSPITGNLMYVYGKCEYVSTGALGSTTSLMVFSGFSNSSQSLSCPVGQRLIAVYVAHPAVGTLPAWSGMLWRESGGSVPSVVGYYGGTQSAMFSIGPRLVEEPPPPSKMFCRTDFSDAGTGSELPIEFAMDWPTFFGSIPVLDEDDNVTDWAFRAEVLLMLPAVEDCTYLEAIELHVCAAVGIGFGVFACSVHIWTVDRWMSNRPYSDDTPELELCHQYPTRPECVPILFPPFIDPIDFGVVCADPPAATWESWDWLGPFLAHYAECLFVPQGGFDRHGQIAASWNASAGGALASSAQAVLDAFYFEGSCGPLFASVDIGGAPMTINTCSWSWAGALKIALYWIVLVLGMWRALSFAISLIQSAIGATPAPTPIGSDD